MRLFIVPTPCDLGTIIMVIIIPAGKKVLCFFLILLVLEVVVADTGAHP